MWQGREVPPKAPKRQSPSINRPVRRESPPDALYWESSMTRDEAPEKTQFKPTPIF
jgi:hypothetical protein